MKSAGDNNDFSLCYLVHEAMCLVDPAGPAASQVIEERFRFSDSLEGICENRLAERMDAFVLLTVMPLPVGVVLIRRIRECDIHCRSESHLVHLSPPRLLQGLLEVLAIFLRREQVRGFLERCELIQGEDDHHSPFAVTHGNLFLILLRAPEEMGKMGSEIGEGDGNHKKVRKYVHIVA